MTTDSQELTRTNDMLRKDIIRDISGPTLGRVIKVNDKTIDVQPVINKKVKGKGIKFPIFRKVPPLFMQGGDHYEAHPIAIGDYCLLIVLERCFDNWYIGQDEVLPPEDRMFNYSDCIAITGLNPETLAQTIPQVTTRRGDNDIEGDYVHRGDYDLTGTETHTGDRNHTGNVTQTGNYTLNGVLVITNSTGGTSTGSGDMAWTGDLNITGDIILNGISLKDHVHSGVLAGGASSGEMVP